MHKFTNKIIDNALSHTEFMDFTKDILETKNPIKPYDSEAYYNYTYVNFKRTEKILRNFKIENKLYNVLNDGIENWTWVLLNEPWCGDGSFSQAVLYAFSLASGGNIDFKVLLRDSHIDIMGNFLTNGGMAIPKLVCLDKDLNVLGTWGPRPKQLQIEFNEWKKDENFDTNTKIKKVNRWYLKDKNKSIQKEFIDLIKDWKKIQNDR